MASQPNLSPPSHLDSAHDDLKPVRVEWDTARRVNLFTLGVLGNCESSGATL